MAPPVSYIPVTVHFPKFYFPKAQQRVSYHRCGEAYVHGNVEAALIAHRLQPSTTEIVGVVPAFVGKQAAPSRIIYA